ncbi:hypothetical protein U8V72_27420 [Priestia filamentosa]|uniref:hypothetical protein n=1 Tax=Priestia filamentosa TaxID=1402861 RepID=UPI00397D7FAC
MIKIDRDSIFLDSDVEITNQEGLSIDVLFKATALIEAYDENDEIESEVLELVKINDSIDIEDNLAIVGKTSVKIYDDKWTDYLYAADADGAHMDIFGPVVKSVDRESVTPTFFKKNDGMIEGKHMVWGRVAIIDTNFHAFTLNKECWNKETSKKVFLAIEDYLVDILNIDFLLLDLNFFDTDIIKTNPSLLLLGDTEKILTLQNESGLHKLQKEAYLELLELGFISASDSNNMNYMIKNYNDSFSYKTDFEIEIEK